MNTEQAKATKQEARKSLRKDGAKHALTLDAICRKFTGFTSFADLCEAKGNYRPTIYTFRPHLRRLADAYDTVMEYKGDSRRASRVTR